jgi:hypothetical protein
VQPVQPVQPLQPLQPLQSLQSLALLSIRAQDKGRIISDDWRAWQKFGKTRHSKTSSLSSSIGLNILNEPLSTSETIILNNIKKSSESLQQSKIVEVQDFLPSLYYKLSKDIMDSDFYSLILKYY